ncbi:MAG: hypothetical protein ACI8TQ_004117 [Planctomycetota bacterium]|jgi:hypothetical protein
MDSSSNRGNALRLAFAMGAALMAAMAWRLELVFDDAFISFRYSKLFALGEGLRFNLGVEPPVEGYSNLLWVLWCSIPEYFGFDTPTWALWSNLACGVALLGFVLRFVTSRLQPSTATIFATALFFAALPAMAVYSTGGLETMAFALAIFVFFERLAGDEERASIGAASIAGLAAVFLRPDGIIWVVVLSVLCGWLRQKSNPKRTEASNLGRAVLIAGGVCLVGFCLHTAWRYSYHGDWVPNTARAKASFSSMTMERGGKYALSYLVNFPTITLICLASMFAAFRSRSRLAARGAKHLSLGLLVRQCLLFVLATLGYSIAVGGDFLPMGRFLLPGLPFVAILFAVVVEGYIRRARALTFALSIAFVVLSALPSFDTYLAPAAWRSAIHYNWNFKEYLSEIELLDGERKRSNELAEMGRALKLIAKPDASLVLGTVGATGYYSDLFLYDQFGLVNREVAALPWHGRRLAAGHDRYADSKFFTKYSPTYLQASLIDVDDSGTPLKKIRKTKGRRIIVLDPQQGFSANKALLLFEGE